MQLHFMRDKYFQCEKTKRYFYKIITKNALPPNNKSLISLHFMEYLKALHTKINLRPDLMRTLVVKILSFEASQRRFHPRFIITITLTLTPTP